MMIHVHRDCVSSGQALLGGAGELPAAERCKAHSQSLSPRRGSNSGSEPFGDMDPFPRNFITHKILLALEELLRPQLWINHKALQARVVPLHTSRSTTQMVTSSTDCAEPEALMPETKWSQLSLPPRAGGTDI